MCFVFAISRDDFWRILFEAHCTLQLKLFVTYQSNLFDKAQFCMCVCFNFSET